MSLRENSGESNLYAPRCNIYDKGVSKQGGLTTLATKGCQKLVTIGNCIKNKPNPEYTIEDLSKL